MLLVVLAKIQHIFTFCISYNFKLRNITYIIIFSRTSYLTRKSNQSRSNKPLFFLMIFFSKPTRFFPATAFIEFWKRRQAVIAWEWDLTNFEEEEQTRPEFEASIKTTRINPVTKKPEPYLPTWNKCYRVTATWSVVLFMVCIHSLLDNAPNYRVGGVIQKRNV